jgi:cytochrome c biogenesis factor
MPILVVALIGVGYKIIRSFNIKQLWKSARLVSAQLIHLAIILLLLGYVGSNFLVVEDSVSLSIGGAGKDVGKYTLYATDFGIVDGVNFVEIDVDLLNYVYQTEYVDVRVLEGNGIIGNERLIRITSTSLANGEKKVLRNEVKVLGMPMEDIYQQAYEDNVGEVEGVDINVKILPLMKLLWGGMWLMAFGMILRITSEKKLSKDSELKKTKEKTEPYYEDLVEEELKKQRK